MPRTRNVSRCSYVNTMCREHATQLESMWDSIIRRIIIGITWTATAAQTTTTRRRHRRRYLFQPYFFVFFLSRFFSVTQQMLLKTESILSLSSVAAITCFSARHRNFSWKSNSISCWCCLRFSLLVAPNYIDAGCYSVNCECHFNSTESFRFGWRVFSR